MEKTFVEKILAKSYQLPANYIFSINQLIFSVDGIFTENEINVRNVQACLAPSKVKYDPQLFQNDFPTLTVV